MPIDSRLLRLATEIEVGKYTPLFQRLNLLNDQTRYLISDPQKLLSSAGGIGEDDHEENSRRVTPVVSQGRYDVDNIRRELLGGSSYCGLEQRLLREGPWEVHESIIARLDSKVEMIVWKRPSPIGADSRALAIAQCFHAPVTATL